MEDAAEQQGEVVPVGLMDMRSCLHCLGALLYAVQTNLFAWSTKAPCVHHV